MSAEWMQRFRDGENGRNEAARAFLALGEQAVDPLVKLLESEEAPITRAGAATVLWQLRDRAMRAVAALERVLRNDPDIVVRLRAAQALTGIAGKEHTAALKYLRSVQASTDPQLDGWIRAEATAILREAGVFE